MKELEKVYVDMGFIDLDAVIVFGNRPALERYVRKVFGDNTISIKMTNTRLGETFMLDGYVPIIWMPRRPRTKREHGTLAHEAVHAVSYMFRYLETPITEDTEEIFCKAVGRIVSAV